MPSSDQVRASRENTQSDQDSLRGLGAFPDRQNELDEPGLVVGIKNHTVHIIHQGTIKTADINRVRIVPDSRHFMNNE